MPQDNRFLPRIIFLSPHLSVSCLFLFLATTNVALNCRAVFMCVTHEHRCLRCASACR